MTVRKNVSIRKAPHSTYQDEHYDRPLSQLAIAHFQDTAPFVASRYFPAVDVVRATDKYDYYPQGYFNRLYETARDEEGQANSVGFKKIEKGYSCGDDALRTFVSDRKLSNSDNETRLRRTATILVTDALLLRKEQDFATKFLTPGNWSKDVVGVATGPTGDQVLKWSDANADPVADVKGFGDDFVLQSGGRRPNRALITLDLLLIISELASIIDRVKYTGTEAMPARVTQRSLAALFEVEELMVMQSVYNDAMPGIEDGEGLPPVDNKFIAEGSFHLSWTPDEASLMTPAAGLTFLHDTYIQHGEDGGPNIRRYREGGGKKGEYIEAETSMDQNMVSPDMGMLFHGLK